MPKVTQNPAREIPLAGLSIDDVLKSTGLSRQTIYNELNAGRLKSFKVGRRRLVSPAALEAWIRAREMAAA